MGDICPPPLVCPKCDSAMKCNMDSVFLFDLIKRWEVREYNTGERYNGTVPRTVGEKIKYFLKLYKLFLQTTIKM